MRARAGIALDRFLVYGTGGAAVTDLQLSNAGGSDDDVLWGWTAGAGVEGMLTDNLTARIEYRYTDYGSDDFYARRCSNQQRLHRPDDPRRHRLQVLTPAI